MPAYLDLESWPRRQQFDFFKGYAHPYFNVCANLDVTGLLRLVRSRQGLSFSLLYHYLALRAANELEPFRYRLRGDRVLVHDRIHAGTTTLIDGERFAFCYFEYDDDFARFAEQARAALESLRAGGGRLEPRDERDDLIHCSVLPWISFTSFSNARRGGGQDSVPKIVFGRYFADGDRFKMPVSVEVHHALMDGLHVGQYFERLESSFARPEALLGFVAGKAGAPDLWPPDSEHTSTFVAKLAAATKGTEGKPGGAGRSRKSRSARDGRHEVGRRGGGRCLPEKGS